MKKFLVTTVVLFLSFSFTSFSIHKFYIGVFQVDYKLEKKEFQITSRVFIDDVEKALETKYKKKLYLATSKENKESDALIAEYFNEKFKISVNNKTQEMVFVAKEYEDDVLICYHTINYSNKIKLLDIKNSILTEQFSDQQNLLHININSNKKSFLFTNTNKQEKLEL
ncbi:DUF6702 family protein [uncultured Flavobacterium sp.]|uniref:DUF6702 family protein n=1 Tax=uncultured Flavobacterium sp. TaxID=165435 RepID=UPI0030C8D278